MISMSSSSCSFPLHIAVSTSTSLVKNVNKVVMFKQNRVSGKKTPTIQMKSMISKDKVFEDHSQGVVCYRDENGEIVCEGYDEGPRFSQQVSGTSCHLRDSEILDLLQEKWFEIGNGGGFSNATKEVSLLQDDSNSKWE